MKKITICMPTRLDIKPWFFASFVNLLLNVSKRYDISVAVSDKFLLDDARNDLIELTRQIDPDYLLFVDTDMIIPVNALDRLIELDKDIVSALYFSRAPPYLPVIREFKDGKYRGINEIEMNKLIEVDAVGFGFILVKRNVIEKMLEKNEKLFSVTDGIGEDVSFCIRAKESDFKIFVDTSLVCGHIGDTIINEKTILKYSKVQKIPKD